MVFLIIVILLVLLRIRSKLTRGVVLLAEDNTTKNATAKKTAFGHIIASYYNPSDSPFSFGDVECKDDGSVMHIKTYMQDKKYVKWVAYSNKYFKYKTNTKCL